MTEHHLLTVRQPWARAIVNGYKPVENRSHAFTRTFRGPLWIHAGATLSPRGFTDPRILATYPFLRSRATINRATTAELFGFAAGIVLGRVDVVDAHHAEPGCCPTEWAETEYLDAARARHERKLRTDVVHLVFENPVTCHGPDVKGELGIWKASRRPGLNETLDLLAGELTPC